MKAVLAKLFVLVKLGKQRTMDLFNNPHTNKITTEQEAIEHIKKYKAVIFSCYDFGIKSKHGKIPSIHLYANFCLTNLRKEITKPFLDKLEELNKFCLYLERE